jgi:hypothetical protein
MYHLGLGLVLFSILAAPGIASATGASFCDGYAEEAAHDAALAERFACDFHGDRWLKDIDTHRTWCRGATQATVEAEAAARTNDLRLCMCQWYADTATAQAAMNAGHECGLTGPRWTLDRSAHYRWCVLAKVPLATLESEVETRRALLAKCTSTDR